jgi:hypothetical protein
VKDIEGNEVLLYPLPPVDTDTDATASADKLAVHTPPVPPLSVTVVFK